MTEPITIIGVNTVVNGNLEGDEDLTIEGRVEGTISLSRTLSIETNGVVHANVNVRNAVINGVLVGNIVADDSVHITEEGRVMGDIKAPRVILVDGASFRGNIDMGDFDVERGEPLMNSASLSPVGISKKTERPAVRVRPTAAPAPAAPAASAPRPAPARTSKAPATPKKSTPPPAAPKKAAPAPAVRSVGKAKAKKKK
jgi:cytoskeletal protein CcmA (bactofilin family)